MAKAERCEDTSRAMASPPKSFSLDQLQANRDWLYFSQSPDLQYAALKERWIALQVHFLFQN
jgi:hypothetical protein